MQLVKKLPDAKTVKTGTLLKCGDRIYEKMLNGKFRVVITKAILAIVYDGYVVRNLTLRETLAIVNISGLPKVPVQRILEDQGWIRSHYGRVEKQLHYLQSKKRALTEAHIQHSVPLSEFSRRLTVSPETVRKFFAESGIIAAAVGRRVRHNKSVLSPEQIDSWNYFLSLDLDQLSFGSYQDVVRRMTDLVVIKYSLDTKLQRSMSFHVDHIVSKFFGYWNKYSEPATSSELRATQVKRKVVLPLSIICHPVNLRIVAAHLNCTKRHQSEFSITKLKRLVLAHPITLEEIDGNRELSLLFKKLGLEPFNETE